MAEIKKDGLPKRIYLKSGGYYHVFRNKWVFLGRDRDACFDRAKVINRIIDGSPNLDAHEIEKFILRIYKSAESRSREKNKEFTIGFDDIKEVGRSQLWKCKVTGIDFDLSPINGKRTRPFAPRIDRIDSSKGYTPDNIRLVCFAVNMAMNEWGDEVFDRMVMGYFKLKMIEELRNLRNDEF